MTADGTDSCIEYTTERRLEVRPCYPGGHPDAIRQDFYTQCPDDLEPENNESM